MTCNCNTGCAEATCDSCNRDGCFECVDKETGNCWMCDYLADAEAEEDVDAYVFTLRESKLDDTHKGIHTRTRSQYVLWETICRDIETHTFA